MFKTKKWYLRHKCSTVVEDLCSLSKSRMVDDDILAHNWCQHFGVMVDDDILV